MLSLLGLPLWLVLLHPWLLVPTLVVLELWIGPMWIELWGWWLLSAPIGLVILCRWVVPLLMSVPLSLLLVSLLPTVLFVEILSLVEVSWRVLAVVELSIFPPIFQKSVIKLQNWGLV